MAFNGAGLGADQWGSFLDNLGGEVYAVDARKAVSRKMANTLLTAPWALFTANGNQPTMADYASTTDRVVKILQKTEHLNPDTKPNAVTLSWGGALAAYMQGGEFDTIDRVVAFSAPRKGITIPDFSTQLNLLEQTGEWISGSPTDLKLAAEIYNLNSDDPEEQVKIIKHIAEKLHLKRNRERDLDAHQLAAIGYEGLKGFIFGIPDENSHKNLLMVHGEKDTLTPPIEGSMLISTVNDVERITPDTRSVTVKNGSHLLPHEEGTRGEIATKITQRYLGLPNPSDS